MEKSEIRPNYDYWQENGAFWVEEYTRRKKTQVLYDIQEFILAEYFFHCTPARVLEFGCGIGRHLKYLREIPGIEIFGYDQSPTMLEGVRRWADKTWFQEHIALGKPITRLPYPDKSFDVVFTAEVLIHICPDDLPAILSELIRISKWQIFHLEPAPDFTVVPDSHNGCWNHDLIQSYKNLGYQCEILPKGYSTQLPYRVVMDASRALPPSIIASRKLLELEEDIQPTLNECEKYITELNQLQNQYEVLQADRDRLWNEIKIWSQDATKKEKAFSEIQADRDRLWNEIQEIQSSRLYRILCSIYGTRLIKTIYKTYYSLFKNHSNKENSK